MISPVNCGYGLYAACSSFLSYYKSWSWFTVAWNSVSCCEFHTINGVAFLSLAYCIVLWSRENQLYHTQFLEPREMHFEVYAYMIASECLNKRFKLLFHTSNKSYVKSKVLKSCSFLRFSITRIRQSWREIAKFQCIV